MHRDPSGQEGIWTRKKQDGETTSQAVLQQASELGVAEGNVTAARVRERVDHITERGQGQVDGLGLVETSAYGEREEQVRGKAPGAKENERNHRPHQWRRSS